MTISVEVFNEGDNRRLRERLIYAGMSASRGWLLCRNDSLFTCGLKSVSYSSLSGSYSPVPCLLTVTYLLCVTFCECFEGRATLISFVTFARGCLL